MQAITVDESRAGVTIENRALPSLAQGAVSLVMCAFFVYMLHQALPGLLRGEGTWLPPFDRLPDEWKTTIIALCLVAAFVIALAPLALSLRTMFFAKVWNFDVLAKVVLRNGAPIARLEECREIVVEGDFRGETDSIDFQLHMKDGRKMLLARGTASEEQLRNFLEAAKAISKSAKIPYRKETLAGWFSNGQGPTWWTS